MPTLRIHGPTERLALLARIAWQIGLSADPPEAHFEVRHAPSGGASAKGKSYRGGQFVPADASEGGGGKKEGQGEESEEKPEKPKKPEKPERKFSPAGGYENIRDSQVVQDYLAGKREQDTLFFHTIGGQEDTFLTDLAHEMGFADRPEMIDQDEMADLRKRGWWIADRGVSNPDYAEQFKSGDYYAGGGISGNGNYSAYEGLFSTLSRKTTTVARAYAGPEGAVFRLAMPPDSKMVTLGTIQEHQRTERKKLNDAVATGEITWEEHAKLSQIIADEGRLAALKGYDGIVIKWPGHLVVLNRSRVKVQKENLP